MGRPLIRYERSKTDTANSFSEAGIRWAMDSLKQVGTGCVAPLEFNAREFDVTIEDELRCVIVAGMNKFGESE